jgi:hypothetical protein
MTGSGGKPRFRPQADAILALNQNIENNPMQSSGRSPAMGVIRPNSFNGSADLYSEGAMGLYSVMVYRGGWQVVVIKLSNRVSVDPPHKAEGLEAPLTPPA